SFVAERLVGVAIVGVDDRQPAVLEHRPVHVHGAFLIGPAVTHERQRPGCGPTFASRVRRDAYAAHVTWMVPPRLPIPAGSRHAEPAGCQRTTRSCATVLIYTAPIGGVASDLCSGPDSQSPSSSGG